MKGKQLEGEERPGIDGSRLRSAREAKGLSQLRLAVAVGTTPAVISRTENGRSDSGCALLRRLCRELDVSADYLLGLSDQPR